MATKRTGLTKQQARAECLKRQPHGLRIFSNPDDIDYIDAIYTDSQGGKWEVYFSAGQGTERLDNAASFGPLTDRSKAADLLDTVLKQLRATEQLTQELAAEFRDFVYTIIRTSDEVGLQEIIWALEPLDGWSRRQDTEPA